MKIRWRSGGILSCSLNIPLVRGEWSASHLTHFTAGKEPPYPLDKRLGGTKSWSGHGGEEKNSEPLPEIKPVIQLIAFSLH
jgi:hypothetical protein